jgi:3',5'-cyclic AMP phosphodiesterase CpdA
MKLVHISDIHFGTDAPALVESLIETLRAIEPDLIVASGDFTMAGRYREFRAAAALIDRFDAPVLATPGNHDLPVYNLFSRFIKPFSRFDRYIASRSVTTFRSPAADLLSLNSARPWDLSLNWSHGRLSDKQVAAADAFFSQSSSRFRALVVHHPFYVPEELPGFRVIGNGQAMLEVLARHRVHAVLSGHLHQQSAPTRELTTEHGPHTVTLLQAASVTSTRHRNQPNAFNVIRIEQDQAVLTEYIAIDGRFQPATSRRSIDLNSPITAGFERSLS